ncbi:MAG: hypothetical protein FH751_07320 [Firmicutes bacterium]|nr:hypothetical protein [Bacillota bacterium]
MKIKMIVLVVITSLIFNIGLVIAESNLPTNLKDAVKKANDDLGHKYYDVNRVNKDVWKKYGVLVYGDTYGDRDSKGEPRYLGKNPLGEPFPNYKRKMDGYDGGYLDDRNWIDEPWLDNDVSNKVGHISDTNYDYNEEYRKNFVEGMEVAYPDIFKGKDKEWEKYFHVLSPPTDHTWGMARMWHKKVDGSIWYLTVPLAPNILPRFEMSIARNPNVKVYCQPDLIEQGKTFTPNGFISNPNSDKVLVEYKLSVNGTTLTSGDSTIVANDKISVSGSYSTSNNKAGDILKSKLWAKQRVIAE